MRVARRGKIFGAGLIALDLVKGPADETPIRSWTGGTCGNVLSILAYLGWDAYPVARLNGDAASDRIRADMRRWGVHLDWAHCRPTSQTPIIVQEIRRGRTGGSKHRFSWTCPRCGQGLPRFRALTVEAIEAVRSAVGEASVFFFDRPSRATLVLAAEAAARGAVVVFEPSSQGNRKYLEEAIEIAHVIKYADDRLDGIPTVMTAGSAVLLEVQTFGAQGLRYRQRSGEGNCEWMHLAAVPALRLADSCGAGDWCTAGLIARIGLGGQEALRGLDAEDVRAALRYGQALAAWNCGFEGARGGMYAVAKSAFMDQISCLLDGEGGRVPRESSRVPSGMVGSVQAGVVTCPACPDATA